MPRTGQQMTDELNVLLKNANIPSPFVLLGHSLGGLNAYLYASRYPEQLAGLVLLDPPPLPFISGQKFPELYQLAAQATAVETLGDIHLVVIASGKPNPAFQDSAEAYQQFRVAQNEIISRQSTNGTFILVKESSHNLYVDAPAVIIDAVAQMTKDEAK